MLESVEPGPPGVPCTQTFVSDLPETSHHRGLTCCQLPLWCRCRMQKTQHHSEMCRVLSATFCKTLNTRSHFQSQSHARKNQGYCTWFFIHHHTFHKFQTSSSCQGSCQYLCPIGCWSCRVGCWSCRIGCWSCRVSGLQKATFPVHRTCSKSNETSRMQVVFLDGPRFLDPICSCLVSLNVCLILQVSKVIQVLGTTRAVRWRTAQAFRLPRTCLPNSCRQVVSRLRLFAIVHACRIWLAKI